MAEPRGTHTRETLSESALELFSRRWYETVSVAEICRHAELSNGIFYHYFRNKETVFRELLDSFIETLERELASLQSSRAQDRLHLFLETIANFGNSFDRMLTVFREGQYRYPEYESHLRSIYIYTLSRIYERNVGIAEYLYITSGVRFLTNRVIQTGRSVDTAQLEKIVEQGIFTVPIVHEKELFKEPERSVQDEKTMYQENNSTRNKLLVSGIQLFGEKGFYNINVYEVARKAGFSVGTFYLHFQSKEHFLAQIVDIIGKHTRHFITINLGSGLNRLEKELRGMFLFLHYFTKRKHYYQIVREAEFVVQTAVKNYYDSFEISYRDNLTGVRKYDSYTLTNSLIGISHYLGIECLYANPELNRKEVILQLGTYLSFGMRS